MTIYKLEISIFSDLASSDWILEDEIEMLNFRNFKHFFESNLIIFVLEVFF